MSHPLPENGSRPETVYRSPDRRFRYPHQDLKYPSSRSRSCGRHDADRSAYRPRWWNLAATQSGFYPARWLHGTPDQWLPSRSVAPRSTLRWCRSRSSCRLLSTLPGPASVPHRFHIRYPDGIYFEHRLPGSTVVRRHSPSSRYRNEHNHGNPRPLPEQTLRPLRRQLPEEVCAE